MGGDGEYPALPRRRRVLVGLLAVATAVTIVLMLTYRPGDPKHDALQGAQSARAASAAAARASAVGAKADVILLPAPASAPR
jgi:uncharacterized protein (UPF0333 family)